MDWLQLAAPPTLRHHALAPATLSFAKFPFALGAPAQKNPLRDEFDFLLHARVFLSRAVTPLPPPHSTLPQPSARPRAQFKKN